MAFPQEREPLQHLTRLREEIHREGYGVLEKLMPAELAQIIVGKIREQVKTLARLYGREDADDNCGVLLQLGKRLHKAPEGWVDASRPTWRLPFARYGRKGWLQKVGGGRCFCGEAFVEDSLLVYMQGITRPVVAILHGVS